jgi:hypothetical protein
MREPEPEVIDPSPDAKVADDDKNKACNHKRRNSEVQRKYDIRNQMIWQILAHLRCLMS